MADVIFSKTTPAAPADHENIEFQSNGAPNPRISGNVPKMTSSQGGLTPTPPNDAGKYLDGTSDYSYPIGLPVTAGVSAATTTIGKIPISQGDGTAAWADPLVQGTKAEGAAIDNPITIGGKDGSGNNKAIVVDSSGRPTVNINGTVSVSSSVTNFPSLQRVNPTGNSGAFTSVHISASTSGSITFTVPANTKYVFKGGFATVTTSSSAGNRTIFIQLFDASGNALTQLGVGLNQPASQTYLYSFGSGFPYQTSLGPFNTLASPFPELTLGPGATIVFDIANNLTGDSIAGTIAVTQYPD